MIEQVSKVEETTRLFKLAIKVANHLGHIPTDQPEYNPLRDADVLTFMEQAIFNEIQAESQQVHMLDELAKEL